MKIPITLARAMARVEGDLAQHTQKDAQLIRVIELINRHTGSSFTGVNLNDQLGRYLNCVLWPLSEERLQTISQFGPTLNALLVASPLHQLVWDAGPRRAAILPTALYQGTQAYQLAYKHAGMHYAGFYDYPGDADHNHVVVVISRADREFSPREIRALQCICDRFEPILNQLGAGAPLQPGFSKVADHHVDLDAELRPVGISDYAHALIALFYGPLRENQTRLPLELVDDVISLRKDYTASVLPAAAGFHFAFTKRHQGRALCVVVNSLENGGFRLTLYEDLRRLEQLRQIKHACQRLRRDRFATLAVCLALLDGANNDDSVRRRAGMLSHKTSSLRRIVSVARSLVDRS